MEQNKQMVAMTEEELKAFNEFQEKQRKEELARRRKDNRSAYAELVNSEIAEAIPQLCVLSEKIKTVKRAVFTNFEEVLKMKDEIMGFTSDRQRSHTFTNANGDKRITLGVNTIDGWRDTVEDGIAMVKKFIESLAVDDNSRMLVKTVMRLLSRDQMGNLKASRVLQLQKMAEESHDETFNEGVKIIQESYQPATTKQFIRAEYKDDRGWHIIPLSVTDVE